MRFTLLRGTASLLAACTLMGFTGCARTVQGQSSPAPYGPASTNYSTPAPTDNGRVDNGYDNSRPGLSTKQKVLLVAGAAALYYLYQKHQNAKGTGPEGQYYRSKNGQIYYRDQKGGVHWVTAPEQPIEVPADEYERYTGQRVSPNQGVIRQAPAGW